MCRILLIFSLFLLLACSSMNSRDPEKANLLLHIGTSSFENGNYPAALTELLKAEQLDPKSPEIQNNLGLVYFMRERYDLAEQHLRKALDLNPKYSEARNNLSRIMIEQGHYSEAAMEARTVLDDLTYPSPEKAYMNLGLAQFDAKDYSVAKETFLRALNLQRDNCSANNYYGRTLFEMQDYANAAEALDTAVGFCQRVLFDEPHYYDALAYYRLGQKDKSVARFQEIVKLYPNGKYREKARAMLDLIRKAE